MKLEAILWDYDGTLVNSVPKNIDITKSILAIVAPHLTGENFPKYLKSESAYHEASHAAKNWQELYRYYYGMSESEVAEAGALWAEHQESNQTEVSLFEGIDNVIARYSDFPHGICSQNSQSNIWNVLKSYNIDKSFKSVIGYEDVAHESQKPHPEAGLKCLTDIFGQVAKKTIMYIGDHEADVKFARNIEQSLGDDSRVISVAAAYSGANTSAWPIKPDYVAKSTFDLLSIIKKYA